MQYRDFFQVTHARMFHSPRFKSMETHPAVHADMANHVNFGNNGSTSIEFGSFDRGTDGDQTIAKLVRYLNYMQCMTIFHVTALFGKIYLTSDGPEEDGTVFDIQFPE